MRDVEPTDLDYKKRSSETGSPLWLKQPSRIMLNWLESRGAWEKGH